MSKLDEPRWKVEVTKLPTRAQIERLWASDRRGPRRSPKRKKRLDPGRKPRGAVTISDVQAMSPEKLEREFPEIWEQRKAKR